MLPSLINTFPRVSLQINYKARINFCKIIDVTPGHHKIFFILFIYNNRRDGVVVRASVSQSVDLGFIPLVKSYRKTLKNGIYSFPAGRSAFMGGCGEQAGKFDCCFLGQGTQRDAPPLCGRQVTRT